MNVEDQAKTKAEELKGQAKKGLGRVTDEERLQPWGRPTRPR
jgi:uncharacterized protein YjbJ (UPF0337 family)